jgi:hypothetical protein
VTVTVKIQKSNLNFLEIRSLVFLYLYVTH